MEYSALKKSGLWETLSPVGKRCYLPPGIIYWGARGREEAEINATLATARGPEKEIIQGGRDATVSFYLPRLKNFFRGLEPDEIFAYAPIAGLPGFRAAWREWTLYKLSSHREKLASLMSQPVVVPGISAALFAAARFFLDESEKFVTTDLHWVNVDNIFCRNIGAEIVQFPLFDEGKFNTKGMKEALFSTSEQGDKALLLLNLPNNPTGFSPSERDAQEIKKALVEVAEETGKWVVVLLDDAYEGYVYEEGILRNSLFGILTGVHPRLLVVKLDGVSKELLFYGGRVGAITFGLPQGMPDEIKPRVLTELEAKVEAISRSTFSSAPRATQELAARVLEAREDFLQQRRAVIEVLKERYRIFKEALQELKNPLLRPLPFNSGFFAFLDLKDIRATDFAEHLITKYKVGVIPWESQGVNGVRVAFCAVEAGKLPKVVECIKKAADDLSG